ncbi:MAG: hypothetical protein ABSG63_12560 [Spirochaetia bacterium]|jgi:hypothetical protein
MGLLRKAASVAARGDAAIADHAPEATPAVAPAAAGLFRKIISAHEEAGLHIELVPSPEEDLSAVLVESASQESAEGTDDETELVLTPQETRVTRPSEELTGEILSALAALPQGVEMPAELFSLLVSRLSITKGALLLFDPVRSVYAPWASVGYDQTTLHRMRITLGANASFNALANGTPLSVTDTPTLALYQPYFSSREFSSVARLLLTPFIAENKLIGVLLVTEASPQLEGEPELLSCLSSIAAAGALQVQKARQEKLQRAGAQGLRPGVSPEEEATRYLSAFTAASARILFFSLSLEEYAKKIVSTHAHLDPFRLSEDLQYFLGAFVSDLGTAIPVRQGVFIVGLQGFEAADLDLFLHQLSMHLHGLFGGNGASEADARPVIRTRRMWPAEGTNIRELVDFLSA